MRREIGADLADMTDGGGWAVACFGDLGLGHGGFRARVGVSEMRTPGATAGDVMCCGREVAAAQRDHAENAAPPMRTRAPRGSRRRPGPSGLRRLPRHR